MALYKLSDKQGGIAVTVDLNQTEAFCVEQMLEELQFDETREIAQVCLWETATGERFDLMDP